MIEVSVAHGIQYLPFLDHVTLWQFNMEKQPKFNRHIYEWAMASSYPWISLVDFDLPIDMVIM